MAEHAYSATAPNSAPTLWDFRGLYVFADAARWIVHSTEADDALEALCATMLARLIAKPVSSKEDAFIKVWLLETAGEREWAHDFCARPVLAQLRSFIAKAGK